MVYAAASLRCEDRRVYVIPDQRCSIAVQPPYERFLRMALLEFRLVRERDLAPPGAHERSPSGRSRTLERIVRSAWVRGLCHLAAYTSDRDKSSRDKEINRFSDEHSGC